MALDNPRSSHNFATIQTAGGNRKRVSDVAKDAKQPIGTTQDAAAELGAGSRRRRNLISDTTFGRGNDRHHAVADASTIHQAGDFAGTKDTTANQTEITLAFADDAVDAAASTEGTRTCMRKVVQESRTQDVQFQQLWCYCSKPDDGSLMIQCSGEACEIGWLHAACVALSVAEVKALGDKKWYCTQCSNTGKSVVSGEQSSLRSDRRKRAAPLSRDAEQEEEIESFGGSKRVKYFDSGDSTRTEVGLGKRHAFRIADFEEDIGDSIAVKIASLRAEVKTNAAPATTQQPTTHAAGITPPDSAEDAAKQVAVAASSYSTRSRPVPQAKYTETVHIRTVLKNQESKKPSAQLNGRKQLEGESERHAKAWKKQLAAGVNETPALFREDFELTDIIVPKVNGGRPAKGSVHHGKPAPDPQPLTAHNTDDHQGEEQEHKNPGQSFNYYSTRSGWDDRITIEESFERDRPMNNAPALTRQDAAAFIEAGQDDSSFTRLDAPPSPTGTLLNEDAGKADISGTVIDPEERLGQQRMLRLLRGLDAAAVEYGHAPSDDDDIEITRIDALRRDGAINDEERKNQENGEDESEITPIDKLRRDGAGNDDEGTKKKDVEVIELFSDDGDEPDDAEITGAGNKTIEISSDQDDAENAVIKPETTDLVSSDENGDELEVSQGANISRPTATYGKGRP